MVRKAEVEDRLYMDEAEGFLLTHALFSPPRTWPPLPPEQPTQAERLQRGAKKMNWDGQIAPDAPVTGVGIAGPSTSPKQRKTSMNAGAAQAGMGDWFEIEPLENGAVVAGGSRHDGYDEAEDGQERCVICLMALRDRTVVGVCGHEFCFECIGVWANQSRRCPLCSADMAPFLLHDLNNPIPTKFYLPPLPTRKFPPLTLTLGPSAAGPSRRVMSNQEGDTPSGADQEEADELDKQVERRREIYRHGLFVKHIPSNPSTGFRPNPTPRQIADTPVLLQRATAFLRRELRIWGLADVEFLLTYVLNLLKAIDLRSEPFIRLLRDVLEPDTLTTMADGDGRHRDRERGEMRQYPNAAEHLAHELHSWLRSPFKELWRWDALAQYDPVPEPKDPKTTSSRAARPTSTSLPVTSDRVNTTAAPGRSISLSRSPSPARSRSRSSSFSSYSSRSPSPHSPRDPTRRDTFLAAPIAGERRWDEPDTWISPSHLKELEVQRKKREKREAKREAQRARWDERVKRRLEEKDAEMREREEKRARYAQEPGQWQGQGQGQMVGRNGLPIPVAVPIRAIHGHGQLGMRAWGREAGTGVELLPDTPAPSALVARHGSDDHGDMQSPAQTTDRGGLAIKGRSSFGQAEAPTRKLTLAERLAKAKADRAGLGWQPDIATDRESGQAARPLREVSGNLPANPADITVEDLLFASPTNEEHDIAPTGHTAAPSTQDVPTTQPHTGETVLERIARARQRLRLRLKLESERACLRHNIAESKAQTLRAKLLEAKIARQAGETDTQLRKMDKLERDKEVRRRLMVAKMMSAETEGERRARELKERLARAKKGVFGRGAVANAGAMRGADMGHGVAGVVQGPEAVQDEGYWEGMGADPLYSVNTYETDVPVLEYDANPDQPQQEYATEAAGTAEPSEPAKTPAAPAVTKQKTAEEKAKEEARRAKILRNLLLERKRAKAASGPETAAASLAGEVVTAAATATEAEAITATPASQPTVEGDEAAVEEVVDIVEEDEWDFEPGAVL